MDTESTFNPVLYGLMRTDLASLNTGKAVAQGMHAANMLSYHMRRGMVKLVTSETMATKSWAYIDYVTAKTASIVHDQRAYRTAIENLMMFQQWESSAKRTPGFGVTIVLSIESEAMLHAVVAAARDIGALAAHTHDDSYPITDGKVTHQIPLDTCGYVFGDKEKLAILLGQFGLHP
jgi:peptidyl-tRNA hydrolase